MTKLWIAAFAGALLASPALAQDGDAAAGEDAFRQCASCHAVIDPEGNVIAGRANVRTGPNLYGVFGRPAGSVEGFRYRPDIVAAGEGGLVWDHDSLTAYLQNPGGFLSETLGKTARSGMAFQVRDPQQAADLAAFLAAHSPEAEGEGEEEAEESTGG
jgi:cytochrome c